MFEIIGIIAGIVILLLVFIGAVGMVAGCIMSGEISKEEEKIRQMENTDAGGIENDDSKC